MENQRGKILPKFCPLSFFSFFINKNSSQSGGCMRCVETECAWWDEFVTENGENFGQCGFMSLVDGVRSLENLPINPRERIVEPIPPQNSITEIISEIPKAVEVMDIFTKLRNLSQVDSSTPKNQEITQDSQNTPLSPTPVSPVSLETETVIISENTSEVSNG